MHTIQTQVQVNGDRVLTIHLPEDIPEGSYQIVVTIAPQVRSAQPHPINELAGKVKAFKGINATDWQQRIRDEWNET
jgi:hypothetical protein